MNVLAYQAPPVREVGSMRAIEADDGLEPGPQTVAEEGILSGGAARLERCGLKLGRDLDTGRVSGSNGTPPKALTLGS